MQIFAERVFSSSDQDWFASVSGDINPMHMDAMAARRTMAGYPVVHGVHNLLWALDSLFKFLPDLHNVAAVKANFEKMVYVGDTVQAALLSRDALVARVEIMAEAATVMSLDIEFGGARPPPAPLPDAPRHRPATPLDLTFDEMEEMKGLVPLPPESETLADAFPAAAAVLGAQRLAALAGSSFLVGMVCPGLHSIYRNLNLSVTEQSPASSGGVWFRVKYADPDYRLLRLAVFGAGWEGMIDTNARPPPTAQASLSALAQRIPPRAFVGTIALVIGGSRGLGELVSKILAAGGAHVVLTFSVGAADAGRVKAEIEAFGGTCDIMQYDIRGDAQAQLAQLPARPNEIYYMATPPIFRRASGVFTAARLQDFLAFYVNGFADLCRTLRQHADPATAILYPSSVAVEDRPANMTEYSMAKAAGEILCADMNAFGKWGHVLVRRLPRLATDQTATLFEDDESDDPVTTMLAIVEDVHAARGK